MVCFLCSTCNISPNSPPTGLRNPRPHSRRSHFHRRHHRLRPHWLRPQYCRRTHCWRSGSSHILLMTPLSALSSSHPLISPPPSTPSRPPPPTYYFLFPSFPRPTNITSRSQYGLGGYRIQKRQTYGIELALLASVLLAGSSVPRAIKSGKPLPIGLSVLAATGLFIYGKAYLDSK